MTGHRTLEVGRVTWDGCGAPRTDAVHAYAVLIYLLRGTLQVGCGPIYTLRAGDLLLLPEGRPHHTVRADDAEAIGVRVCLACLGGAGGSQLVSAFTEVVPHRTVPEVERAGLVACLDALAAEVASPRPWRALAMDGLTSWLAAIVSRSTPAALPTAPARTLSSRALAYITEHATAGISLSDVARHVGRSPAHTAAVVKAETGQTVVTWVTQARLAVARHLLLHSDETVDVIGQRVGFESASHFHRVFKRAHGEAPGAWRSEHAR